MSTTALFVDDEPGIRETLAAILEMHGFQVTTAATVGQALAEITSKQFDVLIADLNIGQPGDGFTVVSAMRRTQPDCVTLILTGYPALETALQAIRSQVDDYLIKPAKVSELVAAIEGRLKNRGQKRFAPTKRLAEILRDNTSEIIARLLQHIKASPRLGGLPVSDTERVDGFPVLIVSLADQLESAEPQHAANRVMHTAALGGAAKRWQGYNILMLLENLRLFEHVIFEVVHENLFSINLSYLMTDLKRLNDSLGLQLQEAVAAFLAPEEHLA
jgi:ActR/RegA family two-component response regulator